MGRKESAAFLTSVASIILDETLNVSIWILLIDEFKESLHKSITETIHDGENARRIYEKLKGESK